MVQFGVLGPVVVDQDGVRLEIRSVMRRTVLATLLLSANTTVTTQRLMTAVWGDAPPQAAVASLHNHVMRLRRELATVGARLRTVTQGYLFEVHDDELDVARFERLCRTAAVTTGGWAAVSRGFAEALALWRGVPLADCATTVACEAQAHRLTELRLRALEGRIDADFQLGRHRDLIPELRALTDEYPLHEAFHSGLMRALHGVGRQAEALATYRRLRSVLVTELGVEPAIGVRRMHERLLADDGVTGDHGSGEHAVGTRFDVAADRPGPAQLPHDVLDFTGREAELATLIALLSAPARPPGVVVVSALTGSGGIGKTTLAVHVGHAVRASYPDGQIYVDLRGSTGQPAEPGEVLARLLRALGADPSALPSTLDELAAAYRAALVERRVLVVLDDARDSRQVRPLLPGSSPAGVLVTSRDRLAGLAAAQSVNLDVLSEADGHALLRRIIGSARHRAEPAASDSIVRQCAGLPLAIRIAGARLLARPGWTLADFADRLSDARRRLDELTADDLGVRASFDVSYAALAAPGVTDGIAQARAFRLLSWFDGPHVTTLSAAAALDRSPLVTERLLEALVDVHLLQSPRMGVYRYHDLLRVYARERSEIEDTEEERESALVSLLDWTLHAINRTTSTMAPSRIRPLTRTPAPTWVFPALVGHDDCLAWFRAEDRNLTAAPRQAAGIGRHDLAWQLAFNLYNYLALDHPYDDVLAVLSLGLTSATKAADDKGRPALHNVVGIMRANQECYDDAAFHFGQTLAIRRRTGDTNGVAACLSNLGNLYRKMGRYEDAVAAFTEAITIGEQLGRLLSRCTGYSSLGELYLAQGRYEQARDALVIAVDAYTELGELHGTGEALSKLATAYAGLGDLDQAIATRRRALADIRAAGNRLQEAESLVALADDLERLDRGRETTEHLRSAAQILTYLGDPRARHLWFRLDRATANGRDSQDMAPTTPGLM